MRFEVFHRDHFTCQYCGAQPPDVVLVCDHIIPVAKGGLTSAENLVTACEGCNAGKSDKSLGDAIARPDADLMYLNIQQEIAELQRYDQAKEQRNIAIEKVAERIIDDTWFGRFDGDWHPSVQFVCQVITKYDAHVAEKAIEATAIAFNHGKLKKNGTWFPYTWAVARNANEEIYGKDEEVEEEDPKDEKIRELEERLKECNAWGYDLAEKEYCLQQLVSHIEEKVKDYLTPDQLRADFSPITIEQFVSTINYDNILL